MNFQHSLSSLDPLLTLHQVRATVIYSKSQLYRMIKTGAFPPPVRLGPGRVGWRCSSIANWLAARD